MVGLWPPQRKPLSLINQSINHQHNVFQEGGVLGLCFISAFAHP